MFWYGRCLIGVWNSELFNRSSIFWGEVIVVIELDFFFGVFLGDFSFFLFGVEFKCL